MAGSPPRWKFTAQLGFFSHDQDSESWDFRASTLPGLGLLTRTYSTNTSVLASPQTQWERFADHVRQLNNQERPARRWKLFYIIRHGEGVHNVKEKDVGRAEWDRYWSKQPSDGETVWEDAELVPKGEQQAKELAAFWSNSFAIDKIPIPQSIYSSPLRRCLHTTTLAFEPFLNDSRNHKPIVREKLRERLGVHFCDRRSSRTWISNSYPSFDIEPGFTEHDELWQPNHRETFEEHTARSTELLEQIFEEDESEFIAFVAHSGAMMALFAATGWKKVPVKAGAVYPLFVCGERV